MPDDIEYITREAKKLEDRLRADGRDSDATAVLNLRLLVASSFSALKLHRHQNQALQLQLRQQDKKLQRANDRLKRLANILAPFYDGGTESGR